MSKDRLEAFSDGVIAILITIMVLELRTPHGTTWAPNQHLLFWLSLIPIATAWMSQNHFPPIPVAAYGVVLLAASLAYSMLQAVLLRIEDDSSVLAAAIGTDVKGRASPLMYGLGIGLSFADRWLGIAAYTAVALMWLIPDRRVERAYRSA